MSGIDAIIFDLGNVLIAVDEGRAAERFATRTGKTRQQIEDYFRSTPYATELALGKLTKKTFHRTVAKNLGFDGDYDEFALIWADIFTPIEPMIAFAESLKTRLPRLILSNTNAIHVEYVLERFPFLQSFDAHIFSHEVGLLKPDAAIYRHTLDKYGLTAGRALFVDDLVANVEAARRLGLQGVHFQNAGQALGELTKLCVSPI